MGEDHRRREGYYKSYFRARKPRFLLLVVSLVGLLFDGPERDEPRRGRPPTYPLWRLVALAVIKQVTGCSYIFLETLAPFLVGIAPDDNTIWRAATNPELKPIIDEMSRTVVKAAARLLPLPLVLLATDSTGLTVREKERSTVAMRKAKKRAYRKLHVTTTLFTNLILGHRLTPGSRNDSPVYRELLEPLGGLIGELHTLQKRALEDHATRRRVEALLGSALSLVERLTELLGSPSVQPLLDRIRRKTGELLGLSLGDAAYFNLKNLKLSLELGLLPLFRPKNRPEGEKESRLLARLREFFSEAEELYGYRGLVEAVFGNMWFRTGTRLASRKAEAQEAEASTMCFTHNLITLIHLVEAVRSTDAANPQPALAPQAR